MCLADSTKTVFVRQNRCGRGVVSTPDMRTSAAEPVKGFTLSVLTVISDSPNHNSPPLRYCFLFFSLPRPARVPKFILRAKNFAGSGREASWGQYFNSLPILGLAPDPEPQSGSAIPANRSGEFHLLFSAWQRINLVVVDIALFDRVSVGPDEGTLKGRVNRGVKTRTNLHPHDLLPCQEVGSFNRAEAPICFPWSHFFLLSSFCFFFPTALYDRCHKDIIIEPGREASWGLNSTARLWPIFLCTCCDFIPHSFHQMRRHLSSNAGRSAGGFSVSG